jgi:hypothetical protein
MIAPAHTGVLEPEANPFYFHMLDTVWCVECNAVFDRRRFGVCPSCTNRLNIKPISDFMTEQASKSRAKVIPIKRQKIAAGG